MTRAADVIKRIEERVRQGDTGQEKGKGYDTADERRRYELLKVEVASYFLAVTEHGIFGDEEGANGPAGDITEKEIGQEVRHSLFPKESQVEGPANKERIRIGYGGDEAAVTASRYVRDFGPNPAQAVPQEHADADEGYAF